MDELHTHWKQFVGLPFPPSAHVATLPLESIDSILAGCISTMIQKGTLEENQWSLLEKTLEQLHDNFEKIPHEAQSYFSQLFEMGKTVLENKK